MGGYWDHDRCEAINRGRRLQNWRVSLRIRRVWIVLSCSCLWSPGRLLSSRSTTCRVGLFGLFRTTRPRILLISARYTLCESLLRTLSNGCFRYHLCCRVLSSTHILTVQSMPDWPDPSCCWWPFSWMIELVLRDWTCRRLQYPGWTSFPLIVPFFRTFIQGNKRHSTLQSKRPSK